MAYSKKENLSTEAAMVVVGAALGQLDHARVGGPQARGGTGPAEQGPRGGAGADGLAVGGAGHRGQFVLQ